jgi:GNAT superfamily N-acetyltransferase
MNLWKVLSRRRKYRGQFIHTATVRGLIPFGEASGLQTMIEPFADLAWAEAHEQFSAGVAAGLGRLARWLRRRDKEKDETPDVTLGGGLVNSMSPHANAAIGPEPATSAAARYCLGQYYRELGERFDGGFDPALSLFPSLDEFAPPRGIFLVVRLDGEPVGCGGLKPISADAAYLRRMWIAPDARGLGFARRLLSALEEQARMLGYSLVRLETNETLVEAQQLYRSSGYCEVPPFNDEPYAHHWFEKGLNRGKDRRPRRRALS